MLIITHKCVIHVNVVDVWIIFCRLDIIVRQLIFGNLNCLNIIMDAVIPVAIMLVSLLIPRFRIIISLMILKCSLVLFISNYTTLLVELLILRILNMFVLLSESEMSFVLGTRIVFN
jgi:hypothetical protein